MEKFKKPEFIEKLKRTPELTFREIVRELYPWFRSFIKTAYRNLAVETEDIIQDVAVKIVEHIDVIDPHKGNFLSLSFKILRNFCIDRIKQQQKIQIESLENSGMFIEAATTNPVPEHPQDFLTIIESLAPETGLREAFLRLHPKDCLIVVMPFAGWTDDEIVDILNIPSKNALWAKRSRAVDKLKYEFYRINGPN
jgi:RNA polymerase sigma factor (sigma-70 family)